LESKLTDTQIECCKELLNILEEIILEGRIANHYLKWIFGVVTKES
jgi:hypothetical protein